jgi:hypothetical protein
LVERLHRGSRYRRRSRPASPRAAHRQGRRAIGRGGEDVKGDPRLRAAWPRRRAGAPGLASPRAGPKAKTKYPLLSSAGRWTYRTPASRGPTPSAEARYGDEIDHSGSEKISRVVACSRIGSSILLSCKTRDRAFKKRQTRISA